MKVYRGAAAAARHYVEADRGRVDDYYLAEGTGLAERLSASPDAGVEHLGALDADGYEAWVAGLDPVSGDPRGRIRQDANAVRFVEVVVNGPKSWSLAAALHPDVADAYDAAMDRAADQIVGWLAEHATTRVGPRGRQVQVPVEQIEAVTVRHYTSRAGDPLRHLHLQLNARVFADGRWRGLHTIGVRDSIDALNGIGHAAVMTDPQFRAALAAHGFTLVHGSGEVAELARFVGPFSGRAAQIGRNIDRYEAEWRQTNPGEEPGPRLRQWWDSRAWAEARPDKVTPTDGADLVERWNDELKALGYHHPTPQPGLPAVIERLQPGALDRQEAVELVVSRLGARRSAWNLADVRGAVEQWIAATGLVADAAVRLELAEDLTARVAAVCVPLLDRAGLPEHIRALTSPQVLAVEADIVTRLTHRAGQPVTSVGIDGDVVGIGELDAAQRDAVAVMAGTGGLVVVDGAAGAGKTTTLAAANTLLEGQGRRMVVVTPTLKAAQVAGREVGTGAFSAAWLVHQHGWRWDDDGNWTHTDQTPDPDAVLRPGDLLLVDEAGMIDQDTARALLTVADAAGARVALVGDRHQLPAVGRGGVLDLAARWATPDALVSLDVVHRFSDPGYAAISLAMRTGSSLTAARRACSEPNGEGCGEAVQFLTEDRDRNVIESEPSGEDLGEHVGEVFDALLARDQIRIYPTDTDRTHALADLAAASIEAAGQREMLVMADTRDQVTALNGAIRDRLVAAGRVDDVRVVVTMAGERLGVGDKVATRRNDRDLGVANRDLWTVTAVADDGTLTVQGSGRDGVRVLPAGYVRDDVELAYATTVHGAQGETTDIGHLLLGEHATGSLTYVGMTRGRDVNVAHLVADNAAEARSVWESTFTRDRADLGPAHAARRAAADVERYAPHRPLPVALADLRTAWTAEQNLRDAIGRTTRRRDAVAVYGDPAAGRVAAIDADLADLTGQLHAATRKVRRRLHEPAVRTLPAGRVEQERADWLQQRRQTQQDARKRRLAQQAVRRPQPTPDYMRTPDPGWGIGR